SSRCEPGRGREGRSATCHQRFVRPRSAGKQPADRRGPVRGDDAEDRRMSTTADLRNERLPEDPGTALPRYAIRTYRLPAKVFHWVTAALVLFMVTTGVTMKQLGSGPVADSLFAIHKTTGVLVLAVVLLRLLYRIVMP